MTFSYRFHKNSGFEEKDKRRTVKRIAVKILLFLFKGFLILKKFLSLVLFLIFKSLFVVGKVIFKFGLLKFYKIYLFFKRWFFKIFLPAKNKIFYPLTRRSIVHFVLIIITIFISTANISAREVQFDPGQIGQKSILHSLVNGEENLELIEDAAEQRQVIRYIDESIQLPTIGSAEEEQQVFLSREEESTLVKPEIVFDGAETRTEIITYVVEAGDTVSTIAEKFNISVNTVLWANKLSSNSLIRPGDKLTILPVTGVSHQVKKGDTLTKIAKAYSADVEEIIKFNKLASETDIAQGKLLIIPGGKILPPPRPTYSSLARVREIFIPPSAPPSSSRMVWPTSGHVITQYFTWRHSGLDIDGDFTSPIYAAESGKVIFVGWHGGYGNKIDIDHGNGIITRYGHLSKFLVSRGEEVSRGQTIGIMGSTGWSTGSHLHFEVIIGGRRTNPLSYIR